MLQASSTDGFNIRPRHYIVIVLVLLHHGLAFCDMVGPQLIGSYENLAIPTIEPPDDATNFPICPDILRIDRVEFLQTSTASLFMLPHRFITLLTSGGLGTECLGSPINSPLTTESSTVLRRNDQVNPLDTNNSLIAAFQNAQETYFLGLELGNRQCGLTTLSSNSASMWMAPDRTISVRVPPSGFFVQFFAGNKYVVYFNAFNPCILVGNANETGIITPAPSPSASTTSTTTATPSPTPTPSASSSFIPSPSGAPPPLPPIDSNQPLDVSPVPPLNRNAPVCFPANAQVQTISDDGLSHQVITIDNLRTGMRVRAGASHGESCQVIGFSHRDADTWSWMIRLTTSASKVLIVSPGHFIYIVRGERKSTARADAAKVGDFLVGAWTERYEKIVSVEYTLEKGLFNPQTSCGDIAVGGVVASTYTAAVGGIELGHALMTPWRAASRLFRQLLCSPSRPELGVGWFVV